MDEVPKILKRAAKTFEERHKIYGDNYVKVGHVMKILFPDGLQELTPEEFSKREILVCILMKLCRFTNSGMTHKDSIHDLMGYAAIMESLLE